MIDRIAAEFGLLVVETPVGFNHIADLMMTDSIVMGGEESGGMSIMGHIPEGDGVLMGLLLLEVMADAHQPLHVLVEDLLATYGPAQYARVDMKLTRPVNKKALAEKLVNHAPDRIADVRIENVQTNDGIKYYLADGSWLLIRPSGTEPVLRVYAEAPDDGRVRALLGFGAAIAEAEK
jgi:phosphomannomutase